MSKKSYYYYGNNTDRIVDKGFIEAWSQEYCIDEFILKSLNLKIYGLEKPVKILKIANDANSYINCEKSKFYIDYEGFKITTYNSHRTNSGYILDILAKDKADKILAVRFNYKLDNIYDVSSIRKLESDVYILPIEEGKEKESIDELI